MADGSPPEGDPRAATAADLARALSTAGGQRQLRDLQRLGLLAEEATPAPPPAAPAAPEPVGPRPISIWFPSALGSDDEVVWRRPPRLPLGDHYASTPELRGRRGRGWRRGARPARIAWFGESAAAGYLYAPHLTPAGLLEARLREAAGDGEIEVVDLARTNETLRPLVETVRASLQLEPDLLVIYAGNNWSLLETPELSPYPPAVRGRQRYADAVRGGGVLGPARRARERLAGLAAAALREIAELAKIGDDAGIPVVVVVPEVNLADWETRQPTVWLPGDETTRWYAAHERAVAALAAGDFPAAEAAAWEMVELDGASGPVPFRLLAASLRGQRREAAARDACISEVDSVHYPLLAFLAAPQATTLARELLLAFAAGRPGWTAIDLRPLFAAWTGSALPGRRLFLDYCHLTAEGMQVAMAAVAAETLRVLGLGEPPWEDLARLAMPEIAPGADAAAKLGAAIHTAHRMLPVTPPAPASPSMPAPPISHWIERALDASPSTAGALVDLADARTAPLSTVLTAAQQRNLVSPCRLELQHGWVYDFLDGDVLQAALAALAARARAGDPRAAEAGREIERLLLSRLALPESGAGVDLARPHLHAEPLARFYPELIGDPAVAARAYHRAPWPESAFHLVTGAAADLSLTLTARLPEAPGAVGDRRGRVDLAIDGRAAGGLELGSRWTTGSLRVAGGHLWPGLHRVTLRWPPLSSKPGDAPGDAALEAALRRLEEGLEADLHPIFGEVWSLVARLAP